MITSGKERIEALTEAGVWGEYTLHDLLAAHARERGDALAVVDQPDRHAWCHGDPARLSFRQLHQASDGMAASFLDAGLGTGDFLVVQLPNIAELVVCYYAASKLGIIVSPIPVQYGAHELQHIATAIGAGAMLTCDRFRNTPLADNARNTLPALQTLCLDRDIPALRELVQTRPEQRDRVHQYQSDNPGRCQ